MLVREVLEELENEGFLHFNSQKRIGTKYSIHSFVVDFYVYTHNLILEVQGRAWHDRTKRQRKKTAAKRNCLIDSGYEYLELWDDEFIKRGKWIEGRKEWVRERILDCLKKS